VPHCDLTGYPWVPWEIIPFYARTLQVRYYNVAIYSLLQDGDWKFIASGWIFFRVDELTKRGWGQLAGFFEF
jgi:hypothetical protein